MECYVCKKDSVYWKKDFKGEDFGVPENPIVSNYTCEVCGAFYEVYQWEEKEESE